ncbi:MAG: hypothetical protein ACK5KO_02465 [Arachnia sp.]
MMAKKYQDNRTIPWNAEYKAQYSDYETFLEGYDPQLHAQHDKPERSALLGALANSDPTARQAIAHRLLDDGANAAIISDTGATPLQVLLMNKSRKASDGPLFRRLVEAGTDINRPFRHHGPPLALLLKSTIPDEDAAEFYDAILARDDLDYDAPAAPGMSQRTLRQLIGTLGVRGRPRFVERYQAVMRARGESDELPT